MVTSCYLHQTMIHFSLPQNSSLFLHKQMNAESSAHLRIWQPAWAQPFIKNQSSQKVAKAQGQMKAKFAASVFKCEWIYWSDWGKSLWFTFIHTCCSNLYKNLWFITAFWCTIISYQSLCISSCECTAIRSWHIIES